MPAPGTRATPDEAARERMIARLLAPCDLDRVRPLIGRTFTPELEAQVRAETGRDVIRALRPGEPASRDYRNDRLNIELDGAGRVVRFTCG